MDITSTTVVRERVRQKKKLGKWSAGIEVYHRWPSFAYEMQLSTLGRPALRPLGTVGLNSLLKQTLITKPFFASIFVMISFLSSHPCRSILFMKFFFLQSLCITFQCLLPSLCLFSQPTSHLGLPIKAFTNAWMLHDLFYSAIFLTEKELVRFYKESPFFLLVIQQSILRSRSQISNCCI